MAEFGPSATSGVISTPRLIGPGASRSKSGFAFARRTLSMPKRRAYSWMDGKEAAALAFELNTQHVDHVAARQNGVEVVRDFHAQLADRRRHQRRRAAHDDLGPSFKRPWMLLRATRLWAMSPTRPTVKPFQSLFNAANGEDVEQALRRMLVGAVAGVDDAAFEVLGQADAALRTRHGAPQPSRCPWPRCSWPCR